MRLLRSMPLPGDFRPSGQVLPTEQSPQQSAQLMFTTYHRTHQNKVYPVMAIIRTYTIRYPVCVCLPMQTMCVHGMGVDQLLDLPFRFDKFPEPILSTLGYNLIFNTDKIKGNKTHKHIKPGWLSFTLNQEEGHFPADTVGRPEKLLDSLHA